MAGARNNAKVIQAFWILPQQLCEHGALVTITKWYLLHRDSGYEHLGPGQSQWGNWTCKNGENDLQFWGKTFCKKQLRSKERRVALHDER